MLRLARPSRSPPGDHRGGARRCRGSARSCCGSVGRRRPPMLRHMLSLPFKGRKPSLDLLLARADTHGKRVPPAVSPNGVGSASSPSTSRTCRSTDRTRTPRDATSAPWAPTASARAPSAPFALPRKSGPATGTRRYVPRRLHRTRRLRGVPSGLPLQRGRLRGDPHPVQGEPERAAFRAADGRRRDRSTHGIGGERPTDQPRRWIFSWTRYSVQVVLHWRSAAAAPDAAATLGPDQPLLDSERRRRGRQAT